MLWLSLAVGRSAGKIHVKRQRNSSTTGRQHGQPLGDRADRTQGGTCAHRYGGPAEAPVLRVDASARHLHLSQEDRETLFGRGYELKVHRPLFQEGNFAALETVTIIGPRSRLISNLRILAPLRKKTQVELAFTHAIRSEE